MKNNFLKKEKGSITVYVLIALIFILAIVFGRYLLANRQLQTQLSALKQVKTLYESDVREYSSANTVIIPGTSDEPLPSGTTQPQGDQGEGDILVETDTGSTIPIYNSVALMYFLNGNTEPYYIYQTGRKYVYDNTKTLVLMSDVTINTFKNDIVSQNPGNSTHTFINQYTSLNSILDFNNYAIFSSDNKAIYKYGTGIYVKDFN